MWLSRGTNHVSEITNVPHIEMCGNGKWQTESFRLLSPAYAVKWNQHFLHFKKLQGGDAAMLQLQRPVLSLIDVLKMVSPFRKKEEPLRIFRVALTNTQIQPIIFHPCQTKPVSQHLFSCHSPLGALILWTTAGFHHKTGKVSFTPIRRCLAAGEEWSWCVCNLHSKRKCKKGGLWCKALQQLVFRKPRYTLLFVFNLRDTSKLEMVQICHNPEFKWSSLPWFLPICHTCVIAKAYYPLT